MNKYYYAVTGVEVKKGYDCGFNNDGYPEKLFSDLEKAEERFYDLLANLIAVAKNSNAEHYSFEVSRNEFPKAKVVIGEDYNYIKTVYLAIECFEIEKES